MQEVIYFVKKSKYGILSFPNNLKYPEIKAKNYKTLHLKLRELAKKNNMQVIGDGEKYILKALNQEDLELNFMLEKII